MAENQVDHKEGEEEEKEEGELEEGELEDDEGEEDPPPPIEGTTPPHTKEEKEEKKGGDTKGEIGEGQPRGKDGGDALDKKEEEVVPPVKERKEVRGKGKESSKRKHRDDDEDRGERRKKKKKRRRHVSSEEEEEELPPGHPKFPPRKMPAHPQTFGSGDMGFDDMLRQEIFMRGCSPPPGMNYGPPGNFGPHQMFRGNQAMSDESFESGSDSEMRRNHRRHRRHRRSRSRSRSPSRKNEAICMYYMHGSCQRGKACPYSHDIQPQRKMELCKFYMMDCCAKREKCLYMHKDFPCKYYHTGVKCKSAEKCKFSHETMTDATRNILLKHIELAPRDILADFPRLTKEAAHMVVSITEAHRNGNPIEVENMPGIIELQGRGFKYVDKAIKSMLKRQAKAKNAAEDEGMVDGPPMMKHDGKIGDSRRHSDFGDMPQMSPSKMFHGKHDRNMPPKHPDDPPRSNLDRNVENLVKSFRNQSYDKGMRNHPPPRSPEWQQQGSGHDDGGDWMDDDRGPGSSSQYMMNGEMTPRRDNPSGPNSSSCMEPIASPNRNNMSSNSNHSVGSALPQNTQSNKLDGMMPCAPKQRDLFQRLQHKHSLNDEDDVMNSTLEGVDAQASNENWYSSDEDAEGSSTKPMWPENSRHSGIKSPSRNPSGSTTPPQSGRYTPPGRKKDKIESPPPIQSPPQKSLFPNFNLDNIKITDLASVLSAVKSQTAMVGTSGNEEPNLGQRKSSSNRDRREISRDSSLEMSRDNGNMSGYPRDMPRNPRDGMPSPRSDGSFSSNPWSKDSWDQGQGDVYRDSHGSFVSPKESDQDHRPRTGDVDLRVLPRADSRKDETSSKGLRVDTDMRMSSESSIYDVDLRQLNVSKGESEEDALTLPFKVPVHTAATEIVASLASHSPMYYHLVKVDIPKPNFSHLKIDKEDPRTMDDPRLRRMLRRNSTEDPAGKSPRAPSRYELDTPFSPTGVPSGRNEQKSSDADSRDPRMVTSRDPRAEPRVDPRSEVRPEPRVDPRTNVRLDPRTGGRSDPRTESRDPRAEQMNDMRHQDPRMSGMYGGGNGGGMMDGGMPYQNMGPGPGPGPGPMGGPPPMTRVDPRGRPGLLGPAPVPYNSSVPPPPPNVAPGMPPPYMMGPGGPGGGFYPDDQLDMRGGNFPPGGSNWGGPGPMPSNDPRFHRDMGDGPHSYTPPPVS